MSAKSQFKNKNNKNEMTKEEINLEFKKHNY